MKYEDLIIWADGIDDFFAGRPNEKNDSLELASTLIHAAKILLDNAEKIINKHYYYHTCCNDCTCSPHGCFCNPEGE